MNLSQKIKTLRQEKQLSQAAMAEKIGKSKSAYFYLERHTNRLTLGQLQNIAEALNVTLSELITGERSGRKSPGNRFIHLVDYSGNHWAIGSAHIDRVQFSPTGIIITHANGYFTYLDNGFSDRLKRFLDNEEIEYSAGNESVNRSHHFTREKSHWTHFWMLPFLFLFGFGLLAMWEMIKRLISVIIALFKFKAAYRKYKKYATRNAGLKSRFAGK